MRKLEDLGWYPTEIKVGMILLEREHPISS
jgi:hypothetical protein